MIVMERIRELTGEEPSRLTPLDSLGLDSLELLELYVEFGVPRAVSGSFETVADLENYVAAGAAV